MEEQIGLYEAMSSTRAVRRLRDDPLPDDVLRRVLEAATWAPSGGNRQPWRVIAVKSADTKRALRDLYLPVWRDYVKARSAGVESLPEQARARAQRTFAAGDRLAERLDRPSVVGGGSLYPAVQNLLLACRAEGLGCVLTTLLVAFEPQIAELRELPEGWPPTPSCRSAIRSAAATVRSRVAG